MLPARLSNGICSLTAGEDRLTLSIQMEIDYHGNVLSYEIFPSIINVHTRLAYSTVRKMLVDNDEDLKKVYKPLFGQLTDMERLCHIAGPPDAARGYRL